MKTTLRVLLGTGKALGLVAGTIMAVTLMPIDRAQAATIGDRNNLNSITGLQIGNMIYDVEFGPQNYTGFFSNAATTPLDETGALQAVNAINAFFNLPGIEFGDGSSGSPGDNLIGQDDFVYLVPFLRSGNNISSIQSSISPLAGLDPEWTRGANVTISRNDQRTYAKLSNAQPVPVPTPALLPGLVGMGLSLWRKKQKEGTIAEV